MMMMTTTAAVAGGGGGDGDASIYDVLSVAIIRVQSTYMEKTRNRL